MRLSWAWLGWANMSSTAFGMACLESVQCVWVRLERTWMGFDAMAMGRGWGGEVGLYRLEWDQLGLAWQGWVGLNCGRLNSGGISYLVPSWI